MPSAQFLADIQVGRKRKQTTRRLHSPLADDDGAVVQGRFVEKDVFQQLGVHFRVDGGTGFDNMVQILASFKDNQRSCLGPSHRAHSLYGADDSPLQGLGVAQGASTQKGQLAPPKLLQHFAQLRLKNNDKGSGTHPHHLIQQEPNGLQFHPGSGLDGQQQQDNALCQLLGVGMAYRLEQLINDDGYNEHIRQIGNGQQPDKVSQLIDKIHGNTYFNV